MSFIWKSATTQKTTFSHFDSFSSGLLVAFSPSPKIVEVLKFR